jgi:hypothetical protein
MRNKREEELYRERKKEKSIKFLEEYLHEKPEEEWSNFLTKVKINTLRLTPHKKVSGL